MCVCVHVCVLCAAFGLVGFLGLLMDGPASIVTGLIGLKIIPTFDQPWFSSSLADFWGRCVCLCVYRARARVCVFVCVCAPLNVRQGVEPVRAQECSTVLDTGSISIACVLLCLCPVQALEHHYQQRAACAVLRPPSGG